VTDRMKNCIAADRGEREDVAAEGDIVQFERGRDRGIHAGAADVRSAGRSQASQVEGFRVEAGQSIPALASEAEIRAPIPLMDSSVATQLAATSCERG